MNKKPYLPIIVLIIVLVGGTMTAFVKESGHQMEIEKEFGQEIFDTKEYYVKDEKSAREIIEIQGRLLRENTSESEVRDVEKYLEDKYEIEAVNLQDIDYETANSIKNACDYMYANYPILKGFLTNITVVDKVSDNDAVIAKCENFTFITNPDESQIYPFVMKNQILLSEREFGNAKRLNNLIRKNIKSGYWPEGTTIDSIVVHELTHALIDSLICNDLDLGNSIYITEKNGDSFSRFVTQDLAANQDYAKEICQKAYEQYQESHDDMGSYEDFCMEISAYGYGLQEDGGISYEETIAEAMADYFIHEENCSLPSKEIKIQIDKMCHSMDK